MLRLEIVLPKRGFGVGAEGCALIVRFVLVGDAERKLFGVLRFINDICYYG